MTITMQIIQKKFFQFHVNYLFELRLGIMKRSTSGIHANCDNFLLYERWIRISMKRNHIKNMKNCHGSVNGA